MANSFLDSLFGGGLSSSQGLADVITPQRTFSDVILPEKTRRALDRALTQIEKHDLLYERWGLAERHRSGLGLAFNFAGPPGTGKTICAEAVAQQLSRPLMVVRHADMQSMWVGQTGKNVVATFKAAAKAEAVLFFDEADAIAGSRFASVSQGYERESNAVVSVLLRELEAHPGVVIFATNLAANFDPAFERRIRAHILFEVPDAALRERIWKAQLHARKTPLAPDVDFRALAERFEATGGDIKNAVLKAAQSAAAAPGPDARKRIHQRHFVEGMEEVLAGKDVMQQSLFESGGDGLAAWNGAAQQATAGALERLSGGLGTLQERQDELSENQQVLRGALELIDDRFDDLASERRAIVEERKGYAAELKSLRETLAENERERQYLFVYLFVALAAAGVALAVALL